MSPLKYGPRLYSWIGVARHRWIKRRDGGRDMAELRALVEGRSVALVGNASSLFEKHHPIDDHDIVIRMNRGPTTLDPRGTGGFRTDILLISGFAEQEFIKTAEHVVYMTPKHRNKLPPDIRSRLYFYPTEWWSELESKIGARPSTGCMGIDLLSRLIGSGKIHLYGFDFWKTPTSYTGKIQLGPHNPSAEELYARSAKVVLER